jgi:uncharacterized glyoxalase superfamily protein PhnB
MIYPMLAVKDVDASMAFYTEKLGFKNDFTMPDEEGKNVFGWVSLGKAGFGLQWTPDLEHRGNGVTFMFRLPDDIDVDKYYADVQAKGLKIVEPLQDQLWGDRSFTIHDPDGYVLSPYRTVKQMSWEELTAAMMEEPKP